jgi:hypothetical protein
MSEEVPEEEAFCARGRRSIGVRVSRAAEAGGVLLSSPRLGTGAVC